MAGQSCIKRRAVVSPFLLVFTFLSSFSGVPKVLQSTFHLPLALVCVPSAPAKSSRLKITLDTNQAPVPLSSIFSGLVQQHRPKPPCSMLVPLRLCAFACLNVGISALSDVCERTLAVYPEVCVCTDCLHGV